ncbi:MAG: N-acetyltransferase [Prochlorothrix sp.]|nr:N-acetyltransferase [Prochlorothrix sp.]
MGNRIQVQFKRETTADRATVHNIHHQAFGAEEGPEIVQLLTAMATDPSAQPQVSGLAWMGDRAIGHILFTPVQVLGTEARPTAHILAPLAVLPEFQRRGVGQQLIEVGCQQLQASGVQLVFVLGDPAYYGRHQFQGAAALGYTTPYPLQPIHTEAWQIRALDPGAIDRFSGPVHCCQSLSHPHYW